MRSTPGQVLVRRSGRYFDLYATKVCLTTYCYGQSYDTKIPRRSNSLVESTRTSALNDVPVHRSIPSAAQTEEGYTWIAYVGTDGNAYFSPVVNFDFDRSNSICPILSRVGLSRDYKRFVFVLENSKDIYIYSFDKRLGRSSSLW